MWVRITSNLLVNVNDYSHFSIVQILGSWCLYGYESVNGDILLQEFGVQGQQKAKDALDELTLKIAALKECKCQQS
jgi:hypothetical protein